MAPSTSLPHILLTLLLILTTLAAKPQTPNYPGYRLRYTQDFACPAVHVIIARASTEPPGTGIMGSLAALVSRDNADTTVEAIDYPATLHDYYSSVGKGTQAMVKSLHNMVQACAENGTKIVLMGYSQGAHVVGDAVCGGGGLGDVITADPVVQPIESRYSDQVSAMILMGDPRFVTNTSYDVGNSTHNGLFPRPANVSCNAYAAKIKSYCNAGDPFCAHGNDTRVHLGYMDQYAGRALAFTNARLKLELVKTANSTNGSETGGSGGGGGGAGEDVTIRPGSSSSSSGAERVFGAAPVVVLGLAALFAAL